MLFISLSHLKARNYLVKWTPVSINSGYCSGIDKLMFKHLNWFWQTVFKKNKLFVYHMVTLKLLVVVDVQSLVFDWPSMVLNHHSTAIWERCNKLFLLVTWDRSKPITNHLFIELSLSLWLVLKNNVANPLPEVFNRV